MLARDHWAFGKGYAPFQVLAAWFLAVLALVYPHRAHADAPRDIRTNQRLWLDGLDTYGTDTGNGGGTNPAGGTQLTGWKDKSPNAYTAGDAASYGTNPRTYPTYLYNLGVSFNGTSDVLDIAGNIFGTSSVTASEVIVVASTRNIAALPILFSSGAKGSSGTNRFMASVPWNDGNLYWDQGNTTGGRVAVNWNSTSPVLSRPYIWGFRSNSAGGAVLRDGAILGSTTTTATYSPTAAHYFEIAGGESDYLRHHDGVISEMFVYSRVLKAFERNILYSHLAAKHGNPGGAGASTRYSNTDGYRYYVGGIGQESDGSLQTGTSAGMTIANSTFLGTGRYLLAGVNSLNPPTGDTVNDAPSGYARRSQRIWYMQPTNAVAGQVTLTFDLTQMGLTVPAGSTVALAYRTGTSGAFTVRNTATYSGGSTVAITAPSPPVGYYALAVPAPPAPVLNLSLASAPGSDGLNASNFKVLPGSVLHVTALVTNIGNGSPDADSTVVDLPVTTNTKFFVGDLGAAGSGPVQVTQGATSSGLTYAYTSLESQTDRLDFSNNSGTTWDYVPMPDAQQADAAVTNLRVRLGGTFANGVSPNFPSFTVKYGLVVK